MTDLHEILSLATDRVEPTGSAAGALATARRRRRTRRGVAASAAAVVLVVGVAVVGQLGDGPSVQPEPAPSVPTVEPTPWDPSTVDDLPAADDDVAPLLPDVLRVPDLAPRIKDDPLDRAVLAVDDGADILLLDEAGDWHCVVVADRTAAAPVLSADGAELAVEMTDGDTDRVVVIDLATGDRTSRPDLPTTGERWTLDDPSVRGPFGWSVRPVAQLADGTGLFQVAPSPRSPGGWRIAHWDPAAGAWTLVTRTNARPWRATSFAYDLLASS